MTTKILSSTTVINIDNNKKNVAWAPNQHIKIISEGSCDTEVWSENSALHHRNKLLYSVKYITILKVITGFTVFFIK